MSEASESLNFCDSGDETRGDETQTVAEDAKNEDLKKVSEELWKALKIKLLTNLNVIEHLSPGVLDLLKDLKILVFTDPRLHDYSDGNIETKAGYFIALQAIVLNDKAIAYNRKDLEINLSSFGNYYTELLDALKESRLSGIIETLCEDKLGSQETIADEFTANLQIVTESINYNLVDQQELRNRENARVIIEWKGALLKELEAYKEKITWLEDLVRDLVLIIQQDSELTSLNQFLQKNLKYVLQHKVLEQIFVNDKAVFSTNYPKILEKHIQKFGQKFGESLGQVVDTLEARNTEADSPVLTRIREGLHFLGTNFFKEWDYANGVIKFKRKDIEKGRSFNLRVDKSTGKSLALLRLRTSAKKPSLALQNTEHLDFSQKDPTIDENSKEMEPLKAQILADLESQNSKIIEGIYIAVLSMLYSNLHPKVKAGEEFRAEDIINQIFYAYKKNQNYNNYKYREFLENIVIKLLSTFSSSTKGHRDGFINFISQNLTSSDNLSDRLLAISTNFPSDQMIKTIYRLTVNDTARTTFEIFKVKILEYRSTLIKLLEKTTKKET
ncbi:MAG: hypothetical protein WCK98_06930 [bacterium]